MFQKLPVNGLNGKKMYLNLMKIVIKNISLKCMLHIQKTLLNLGNLPFLAEKMEIKKCDMLLCNINSRENYFV